MNNIYIYIYIYIYDNNDQTVLSRNGQIIFLCIKDNKTNAQNKQIQREKYIVKMQEHNIVKYHRLSASSCNNQTFIFIAQELIVQANF
jgi:uncharacterized membrane protein